MTKPGAGVLGRVSAAHLVSHFHIMTLPALVPLLPAAWGVSFVDLGLALGVFNGVTAAVQAPLGFAVDRFGGRRLLLGGLCLGSASFAMLAVWPTLPVLVAAMACAGVANAVYHPADYALLSRGTAPERMGRAFSVHTFAGFLGSALAPPVLIWLGHSISMGAAFAASAAIGAVAVAVVAGLPAKTNAREQNTSRRSAPGPTSGPIDTPPCGPSGRQDAAMPPRPTRLASSTVLALTGFFLLLHLSSGGIEKFSVPALVDGFGIPLAVATLALTVFLFSSAFGVLAGGVLADRTRHHGRVTAGAFGLAALLIAAVALLPLPAAGVVGLIGGAGFLTGCIAPSRDMLVRAASPPGAEGRVFGLVSTGFNLGGVVGPLLFGTLLDHGLAAAVLWTSAGFMAVTALTVFWQERRNLRKLPR